MRQTVIEESMRKHFSDSIIEPMFLSAERMRETPDHNGFGWAWPHRMTSVFGAPRIIIPMSPELIDQQTERIDDDSLSAYLSAIGYWMSHEVNSLSKGLNKQQAEETISKQMVNEHGQLYAVLTNIQLWILDHQY